MSRARLKVKVAHMRAFTCLCAFAPVPPEVSFSRRFCFVIILLPVPALRDVRSQRNNRGPKADQEALPQDIAQQGQLQFLSCFLFLIVPSSTKAKAPRLRVKARLPTRLALKNGFPVRYPTSNDTSAENTMQRVSIATLKSGAGFEDGMTTSISVTRNSAIWSETWP